MFKFVNKIPLGDAKITLVDYIKKQNQALTKTASVQEPEVAAEVATEEKVAEVEVVLEKEAGKLPKGLQDYLDKKNGKKDDKKSEKKDEKEDEKDEDKEDKKPCCAETEVKNEKTASSPKWVKVSKLTAEQKTKIRDVWGKVYPKDFLDAWLAD